MVSKSNQHIVYQSLYRDNVSLNFRLALIVVCKQSTGHVSVKVKLLGSMTYERFMSTHNHQVDLQTNPLLFTKYLLSTNLFISIFTFKYTQWYIR